MDSSFNRQIEMMQREGFDPAVLREAIRRQTERKARYGLIAVAGMMVGLAVISLVTPEDDQRMRAGFGTEPGAIAEMPAQASSASNETAGAETLLWQDTEPPTTVATTPNTPLIWPLFHEGIR